MKIVNVSFGLLLFFVSVLNSRCEKDNAETLSVLHDVAKSKENTEARVSSSDGSPSILGSTAELHASFSDELKAGSNKLSVDPSILNKLNVGPELSETVEEIVLTLAGSATTDQHQEINATEDRYIVRAQPKQPGEPSRIPTVEEYVPDEPVENGTEQSAPPVRVAPDDIPSFSEWAQQQLAERRRADPNVTEKVRNSKVRSKNYASPDCGAKIVAANPEAVSAASVLSSSRDEYMLNHCTARIWFIIELCEAVQAKQLDLANFELFSSSPKEFSISLGSRFPSRDWSLVGRFTAQDSRDIQTFTLNPYLFGKYLKVEVHSHYGKEHYCPLSWVRVFGTSEYEVLATEDERHGDDDDDLAEEEEGSIPRNLFSSATDAVLSIVKKATAPFMKSEESNDVSQSTPSLCVTPRHLTVCNNCSQHTYDNVFYLISCQQHNLYQLVAASFVRETLIQTDVCHKYGLDFVSLRKGAPFPDLQHEMDNYLSALLREHYIIALCNVLAVLENRVVVNMSMSETPMNLGDFATTPAPPPIALLPSSSTCEALDLATSIPVKTTKDFSSQIKPTKTLREEEARNLPPALESASIIHTDPVTVMTSVPTPTAGTPASTTVNSKESLTTETPKVYFVEKPAEEAMEGKESREPDSSLDAIFQDLSELERVVNNQPASSTPPPGPPKDSLFLRLANRIKNLELNMSLSSSYLEELSRRYRLQLEVLGQTVNATAKRLEELVRLEELRSRRREEELLTLRVKLTDMTREMSILVSERNSWFPRPIQIIWFLAGIAGVWYFMSRYLIVTIKTEQFHKSGKLKQSNRRNSVRRNSADGIPGHVLPQRCIERRPSDEALEITLATNFTQIERKRKKKRKENSRKSSAVMMKKKKSDIVTEVEEAAARLVVRSPASLMRTSSEPPPSVSVDNESAVAMASTPTADEPTALASDVLTFNRFAAFQTPGTPPAPGRLVRRFSSPGFMKTAMSSRSARSSDTSAGEGSVKAKKESGFKKYIRKLF